jgi:hypothetical protein
MGVEATAIEAARTVEVTAGGAVATGRLSRRCNSGQPDNEGKRSAEGSHDGNTPGSYAGINAGASVRETRWCQLAVTL